MGITRAEFLRLLPVAVGNEPFRIEGDDIVATGEAGSWRIHIEERPGRAFGPVALPVLAVTLAFDRANETEARAFVERFLLGYQRAGG
jgi:hypothetical protein